MYQDVMSLALSRKEERPDIFKPFVKPIGAKSGYESHVYEMIIDLKVHVPEMGLRMIADFVGVSLGVVQRTVKELDEEEFVPVKTNEEMCADELAALMATGCQGYGAVEETNVIPLRLHAPAFCDAPRKADQSHLKPRPITLPTFPIIPLRIREAA